jgi:methyl-accepting chemotaxis protein
MRFIEYYFDETRSDVLSIAENYSRNEELKTVFQRGDRERLDAMIAPIFQNLNLNNNITVFEYGGRDGVVFTRGHHPGKFGDGKSDNPSIAAALQGEVVSGFEFGSSGLAIRAFVPIRAGSEVIGTLQTGFNLSGAMLSQLNDLIQGDVALYERDVLNQTSREDEVGLIGEMHEPAILERLLQGEERVETLSPEHFQQTYIPLYDPFGRTIQGMIRVGRDLSAINYGIERTLRLSLGMSVAGAIMVIVVALVLGTVIVTPINLVTYTMRDIAGGEGDLSRTIPIKRRDEIGELSRYFNEFLAKLNGIVASIRRHVRDAEALGDRLHSSMASTGNSTEDILTAVRDIRDTILRQSTIVTEVSSAIEEMVGTTEEQDKKIQSQSTNVSESSSAIEEMIANIQSISQGLTTSSREFEQLHRVVEEGNGRLGELSGTITSLSHKSELVEEANAIITGIASQTNLLSMNAAIEAAHAGDAGKGFSVVADEIRKLSEVSNEQSRVIAQSLADLKGMIESAVTISDQTSRSFESIVASVQKVNDIEAGIAGSLKEQAAGSTQVLNALTGITQITQEVHGGSTEMLEGGGAILKKITGLVSITETIRESVSLVADKAETVNKNAAETANLLDQTADAIGDIEDAVSRFKLTDSAEDQPSLPKLAASGDA